MNEQKIEEQDKNSNNEQKKNKRMDKLIGMEEEWH